MLTTAPAGRRPAPAAARSVLARALPGALRGLPYGTVAALLAFTATPVAVVAARHGERTGALVAAALVGGVTAAFLVDDPAAVTLASVPTTLARRRLLRLFGLAACLAATWAVVAVLAATRGPLAGADLTARAAEAFAASGLAAGVGGAVERRGVPSAALAGVVTAAIGVLCVSALAWRIRGLPSLGLPPYHDRWWLVGAAGWAAAAWSSRDPARR